MRYTENCMNELSTIILCRVQIVQDATPGVQKPVDLQKIFTPAEDAEEIVPQKNREFQVHQINGFFFVVKILYHVQFCKSCFVKRELISFLIESYHTNTIT